MPKRIAADTRRLINSVAVTAAASFGASSPSVRNIVARVEASPGRPSAVIAAGEHTLSQERHEKHNSYHGRRTKLGACHLSLFFFVLLFRGRGVGFYRESVVRRTPRNQLSRHNYLRVGADTHSLSPARTCLGPDPDLDHSPMWVSSLGTSDLSPACLGPDPDLDPSPAWETIWGHRSFTHISRA